jgi:hypothetical protein
MNAVYCYKPSIGFVGTDYVGFEVYYNKTGEDRFAYIERVIINFTITD